MSDASQAAAADTHLGGDATGGASATAPAAAPAAAPVAAPAAAPAASPAPAAPAASPAPAAPAASPAPTAAPAAAAPKPAGAPEAYEAFKLPEGAALDEAATGEFTTLAKELNLSQEQAQKLIDLNAKVQQGNAQALQTALATQGEKWGTEAKADKEFGGDAFDQSLAVAKGALDKFGTPELKQLLVESKLGNHPEVIRFMFRAGKAISQDGFVPGRQGAPAADAAKRIYDKSNMNP